MHVIRVLAACLVIMLAMAPRLAAQGPVGAARQLYAAAEYEEALRVLDGAPPAASRDERQAAELYRALCLLALGRRADADRAFESLVMNDPLYRPVDDLPPRLRAAFTDARRRVLPVVVQQQYSEAKTAYDKKLFVDAAAGFRRVVDVLNDSDMAQTAAQPPLSDLRTLATGFHDLSVKAIPPPPPPPPPPAPVAAPPAIFTGDEPGVIAPVAIRQELPRFPGAVRPGGIRGVVEVLVDEEGSVASAVMITPTTAAYDKVLLTAASRWAYHPAMHGGKPVKFRKRIQITINEPSAPR